MNLNFKKKEIIAVYKKLYFKQKNQRGFALLFAVIVSVILLAVGSAIISIALKEISLSGTGRDSQKAFYASNTGIECALFWDFNAGLPDSTTLFNPFPLTPYPTFSNTNGATCADNDIIMNFDFDTGELFPTQTTREFDLDNGQGKSLYDIVEYQFSLEYGDPVNDPCVDVTVTKVLSKTGPDASVLKTIVESNGYNRCDRINPRTIQRGLDVRY